MASASWKCWQALALLTIVLLGVYSGISTATRIVRSGSDAIERMDEIRSAQTYLRSELAQALVIPFGQTDDGDPVVFTGNDHSLRFVAPCPATFETSGRSCRRFRSSTTAIRLSVLKWRLPCCRPMAAISNRWVSRRCSCAASARGRSPIAAWTTEDRPGDWQDSWGDHRRTPSLVRLTVETEGNVAFPTLVAPIRIDASASRNGFNLGRGTRGPVIR